MTVRYLNDADAAPVDPAATPDGEALPGPREELGRYADLGGFTLAADTHPWYAAADAIGSPEDARAASTVLAELRSRDVSATRAAVSGLTPEGDLDEPDTLTGLSLVVGVLQRVQGTSARLRVEAYDADLDALTAATAGARWRKQQGVKLSWSRRRALRAQAKDLALGARTRRADLHEALAAAAAERADWAALTASTDGVRPTVAGDAEQLAEAAQAVEALGQAVRALGRLLPGRDLESLPLGELAELIDRLAADEGTLYRLPTLRSLRAGLAEQGLEDLLTELTERQADREAATAVYDRHVGAEAADGGVEAARQALAAGPRAEVELEAVEAVEVAEVQAEVAEVEAEAEAVEVEVVEAEAVEVEVEAEVEPTVTAEVVAEEPVAVEEPPAVESEPEAIVEPAATPEVAEIPEAVEVAEVADAPETVEVVEVAEVAEAPETVEVPEVVEPAPVAEAEPAVEAEAERPKRVRRPKKPELTPGRPITAYTPEELTALVRWIDSDFVERTDDELLRATMKELGFARLGPRIKEALGAAVSEARS